MFDEIMLDLETRMDKAIENLQFEFGTIRTGRANTSLLENIMVDYYGGSQIRLNIPQLTEERRKELVKLVHKRTEEARVAVRNVRRDGNEQLKREEKKDGVSEDQVKVATDDVQKLTDKKMKEIDRLVEAKEKEVLEV